jgi:hypothetical protein
MSFIITFCFLSSVFLVFLIIFKGVGHLWRSFGGGQSAEYAWQLKIKAEEALKGYHGKYKVQSIWCSDNYEYHGKLYSEDYDFPITIKTGSIDDFLTIMEKDIQEDAWAKELKRWEGLSPEEKRLEEVKSILVTVFAISSAVLLISFISIIFLSSYMDSTTHTAALTFLVLSAIGFVGSILAGLKEKAKK